LVAWCLCGEKKTTRTEGIRFQVSGVNGEL
jgi:hypothetical protein